MAPPQYIVAEMKEFGVPTWRTGSIPFFWGWQVEGPQLWDHYRSARLYWQRAMEENEARGLVVVSRYFALSRSRYHKGCNRIYLGIFNHSVRNCLEGFWFFFCFFFQRYSNTQQIIDVVTFFAVFK